MIGVFKIVLNEWEENIRENLRRTPKEHISFAHSWATRKVKRNIPEKIEKLIKMW